MDPLFSIFIPARNEASWLPGAVESVRAQGGDWELVIGDNDSTDGMAEGAGAAASSDERIRYHRWPDATDVIGNFNRTASLCRGRWLVPMGADDRLAPNAIDVFSAAAEGDGGLAMIVAECARVTPDGQPAAATWRFYQKVTRIAAGDYDAAAWIRVMARDGQPPWNIGSVAFSSAALEATGGLLNPEAGAGSDIELVMRMAAAGVVRYVRERVLVYTQRTDSDQRSQLHANRGAVASETIQGRGLRVGLEAHERLGHVVTNQGRRSVLGAIARSHIQRAAQHRMLPGGLGRAAAWSDVRRAWSIQPVAVLAPRQLVYASGAVLAPRWALHAADRLLRRPSI